MLEGARASSSAVKGSTSTSNPRSHGGPGFKVCVKCNTKKEINKFPEHGDGEKGSYCRACKNELSKERRIVDAGARLRHYIVTRIKNEMSKEKVPADIHTNLEHYLGYRLYMLKKHLRTELKEREGISLVKSFRLGYHMDHVLPHKSFNIIEVGDEEFKKCWYYTNLKMLSAEKNLKKGTKDADGFY